MSSLRVVSCLRARRIGCLLALVLPAGCGGLASDGAVAAGAGGCAGNDCVATSVTDCTYAGATYEDGAWFPAGEDCNYCVCNAGVVQCSEEFCGRSCRHLGEMVAHADYRKAADGCNDCRCTDGEMRCTRSTCSRR